MIRRNLLRLRMLMYGAIVAVENGEWECVRESLMVLVAESADYDDG